MIRAPGYILLFIAGAWATHIAETLWIMAPLTLMLVAEAFLKMADEKERQNDNLS